MAKTYWETPLHRVTKSLFGPWYITYLATGKGFDVPVQVSNRFAEIVKMSRKAGYDTKRDPAAIGMVFSWMITVTTGDPFDESVKAIMFADDHNTMTLLGNIYKALKVAC